MKLLILIVLFLNLCAAPVSGQDSSGNRKKVINMILSQSHAKTKPDKYVKGIYAIDQATQTVPQGLRILNSIPRYCLAKGAVICRLEEYVQLHTPFKLNIGLGGE